MKIYNIKDKEEFLYEVCLLEHQEWSANKVTGQALEEKIKSKIDKIKSNYDNNSFCKLILVDQSKLIGFVSLFPEDLEGSKLTPWFATMYVKKEYRGKGYSKILSDALIKEALNRGFNKIYLKTDLNNYYEKLGFTYLETKGKEKIYFKNLFKNDYEALINRTNILGKYYLPSDLIQLDDNENNFHGYLDPNHKPMVRQIIIPCMNEMFEAAKKKGFNIIVDSGYRSYDYQQCIWNNSEEKYGIEHCRNYVAPPGASEHQAGLAIDVACYRDGVLVDVLKDTDPELIWLHKNCYKYGFILRYPKGKEDITGYAYEQWHFRYVGKKLSKILHDKDITLEEYYDKI